jgi:hypothetical protein
MGVKGRRSVALLPVLQTMDKTLHSLCTLQRVEVLEVAEITVQATDVALAPMVEAEEVHPWVILTYALEAIQIMWYMMVFLCMAMLEILGRVRDIAV